MTSAFSTPRSRKITLILLGICGLLAIAAVLVGIDDNPPGVLLAFLAAAAFVLAFVHPWRTARRFLFLLLAAVLGVALFVILNIIADSAAQDPASPGALRDLMESPAFDAFSVIFAMLCSAAFIIGGVGSIVMFVRGLRQRT